MEAISDLFGVIITGRWNPHIFSPEWVKQNLCEKPESEVTLAIPVDPPDAPVQLSFDDIKLYPSREKLDLRPNEPTAAGVLKSAAVATKVLTLLAHTPVSGVGINFGFIEKNEPEKLTRVFTQSDAANIDSERFKLQATDLRRSFLLDDGRHMNLLLQYGLDRAPTVNFNFHHLAASAEAALYSVDAACVTASYNMAIEFLTTVYNLVQRGEQSANEA